MQRIECMIAIMLVMGLLTASCWKRQDHAITVPETPVYMLSGRVLSSSTGRGVDSALVRVQGIVKYNQADTAQMTTFKTFTTQDGTFSISEIPGGYGYDFSVSKPMYSDHIEKIVIQYRNRRLEDVYLGRLLQEEQKRDLSDRRINGIAFDGTWCWVTDLLQHRLIQLDSSLTTVATIDLLTIQPNGLAVDADYFLTLDSATDSLRWFSIDIMKRNIMTNKAVAAPADPYHPEQILQLRDFDLLSGEIWGYTTSYASRYCRFDPAGNMPVMFVDSPVYGGTFFGIGMDGEVLYAGIYVGGEYRIYAVNTKNGEIMGYQVIPGVGGQLSIDGGALYLTTGHYIYRYRWAVD